MPREKFTLSVTKQEGKPALTLEFRRGSAKKHTITDCVVHYPMEPMEAARLGLALAEMGQECRKAM